MNFKFLATLCMIASIGLIGCSQTTNPTAPDIGSASSTEGSQLTTQAMIPKNVLYTGQFGDYPGVKPFYWFDAVDNPGFNATILTGDNGQSANVTRVNGGTWGKIRTFAITASADYNAIRLFIPSHSNSMSWKIVIQEEGGAWRNWILQDSTGVTGYMNYDFDSINTAILAGSGVFTIEIVIEGAVGQHLEISELYVYNPTGDYDPDFFSQFYWIERFAGYNLHSGDHTAGWFDATTNPIFDCTITNSVLKTGRIAPTVDMHPVGGKVISPVIPWDSDRCNTLTIGVVNAAYYEDKFTIVIQEQTGSYRRFEMTKTYSEDIMSVLIDGFNREVGYTVDLSNFNELPEGTPFSIAFEGVKQSLIIRALYLK